MAAVQSVIFHIPFISYLGADLLLLPILYFAVKKPLIEGLTFSFILSYIAELNTIAPSGLVTTCYMITYISTNIAKDFLLFQSSKKLPSLVIFGCLAWKISFLVAIYFIGALEDIWGKIILFFPIYVIAELILAKPLFHLFQYIDALAQKLATNRHASS